MEEGWLCRRLRDSELATKARTQEMPIVGEDEPTVLRVGGTFYFLRLI